MVSVIQSCVCLHPFKQRSSIAIRSRNVQHVLMTRAVGVQASHPMIGGAVSARDCQLSMCKEQVTCMMTKTSALEHV